MVRFNLVLFVLCTLSQHRTGLNITVGTSSLFKLRGDCCQTLDGPCWVFAAKAQKISLFIPTPEDPGSHSDLVVQKSRTITPILHPFQTYSVQRSTSERVQMLQPHTK